MTGMQKLRILLWAAVGAVAVAVLVLSLTGRRAQEPQPVQTPVTFGGPFTLVGSDGQPFSRQRLAGRPHVMFFGFTNCPDVCPTTLARLVKLRRQLGKGKDAFDIVFVSVDPERDGPEEVGKYAQLFGEPVIGLTGSPDQIAKVKKDYGIFSEKVPTGDTYTVDHTAAVLLFDRNQQFQGTIAPDETDAAALAKRAGLSLRQLERLFHRHLGVSPRGYYQRLRLARARDLVQGTMMGLAQVAEAVGFDSLSHFSKCYMDAHGIRPSEDRQRHFTTPGDGPGDGLTGDAPTLKHPPTKRPSGARRRAA